MNAIQEITFVGNQQNQQGEDNLLAYCSCLLTGPLGRLALRDMKVMRGRNGLFVAMPSRRLTFRCPDCGEKNHLLANYCNACGRPVEADIESDERGREKIHADLVHPIDRDTRQAIEARILDAYHHWSRRGPEQAA